MVLFWSLAESPGEQTEREMLLQTHHLIYQIAPARDLAAQYFFIEVIHGRVSGSVQFSSVTQSWPTLRPHESQHARPPCPSPTPGVHSDSCPSSQRCHPAISSSVVPFSSCPQSLPASVFSNESTLHMRWPKYWSFSFSIIPSKEHPG